jgi:hypothetical protein
MDFRNLVSATVFWLLMGTIIYAQTPQEIQCGPDTLGNNFEKFTAIRIKEKERFILRIYPNGLCALDYYDEVKKEITKNACIGRYQTKGRKLWIIFDCFCLDVSKDPQLFVKRRWGWRQKSGDFKDFYLLKNFRKEK